MIAALGTKRAVLSGFSSAMSRSATVADYSTSLRTRSGTGRTAWHGWDTGSGTNELSPVAQAGFDSGYLKEVVPCFARGRSRRLGQALRRKKTVV